MDATKRSPVDFDWTAKLVPKGFKARHQRALNNIRSKPEEGCRPCVGRDPAAFVCSSEQVRGSDGIGGKRRSWLMGVVGIPRMPLAIERKPLGPGLRRGDGMVELGVQS